MASGPAHTRSWAPASGPRGYVAPTSSSSSSRSPVHLDRSRCRDLDSTRCSFRGCPLYCFDRWRRPDTTVGVSGASLASGPAHTRSWASASTSSTAPTASSRPPQHRLGDTWPRGSLRGTCVGSEPRGRRPRHLRRRLGVIGSASGAAHHELRGPLRTSHRHVAPWSHVPGPGPACHHLPAHTSGWPRLGGCRARCWLRC